MPFGAHETMEAHEILNEKINLINHFSLYAEHAQSGQVRNLVERHLHTAIQLYDQLVAYTHDYNAAGGAAGPNTGNLGGNNFHWNQASYRDIRYGLDNPVQVAPQRIGRLSDQQILSAVLICHKQSAKNHMQASLECADPNVRQMLVNGAVTCADQAYETFLFMNQQGQYQVPTMNDHTAKTFLHTYQPVNQMNDYQ